MVMMVSFTGNVEAQLTPFLACIVGGSIGLYVALGWHTPSPALVLACRDFADGDVLFDHQLVAGKLSGRSAGGLLYLRIRDDRHDDSPFERIPRFFRTFENWR